MQERANMRVLLTNLKMEVLKEGYTLMQLILRQLVVRYDGIREMTKTNSTKQIYSHH
jgi:hypothetical protein